MTKRQSGQAMTETIVAMSALVVFFLGASTLYLLNQGTINATQGARLSVWYQSLFGPGSGLTAEQVREDAQELVGDVYVEKRHDVGGRRAAGDCDTDTDCFVFGRINGDGVWTPGVDSQETGSISPTLGAPASRSSAFANFVGLENDTIRRETISIPVNGRLSILEKTRLTGSFADYGDPDNPQGYAATRLTPVGGFSIDRSAALLSNTGVFVPASDSEFKTLISSVSSDGVSLAVFEPWRVALAPFQESLQTVAPGALSTPPDLQSTVLPPQLGEYDD